MKVLALTRYSRLGASSRLRTYQYLPALAAAGIDVVVAPLFSDDYVRDLQQDARHPGSIVIAFARRVQCMMTAGKFDLLWIEKELLPWLPAWIETLLWPARIPVVLDYDDAVFHYYDQHHSGWVRRLLGHKHHSLVQRAAVVVAGNAYLADHAEQAGARRVEVLPTVIDLERYPPPQLPILPNRPPCVGWIGQRVTANFLLPHKGLFTSLTHSGSARFTAIGIDAAALNLPMASIPWTEDSEVDAIRQFDIGIMPLVDEPFERGKCGYKLIQYMACGLPVVASPVGVNRTIVQHGVNGFLADSPEEWKHALRTLLNDAALRQRMGAAGRARVEQHYCLQVTAPGLINILQSLPAVRKTGSCAD